MHGKAQVRTEIFKLHKMTAQSGDQLCSYKKFHPLSTIIPAP